MMDFRIQSQPQSKELASFRQKAEQRSKGGEVCVNSVVYEEDMFERKVQFKILKSLVGLLEDEKIFLKPDINLAKLSSIVGTNTTYLSNTVNQYYKCNLKFVLNGYRIAYAKQLIVNNECVLNDLYKECGFVSKSAFYASFGEIVGMPPTQFLQECRKGTNQRN